MKRTLLSILALGVVACGDDGGSDGREVDAGSGDSGTEQDMFRASVDMGRADSGSDDSCVPSGDDLTATVGCNGEPVGPDAADDSFGGLCTGTAEDAGSCTFEDALCSAVEGESGYCLALCEPDADEYITTGGCPAGSRCFTLDTDLAICFPDCRSADDCLDGFRCDEEGSCVEGDPVDPDGGVADDGGVMDGGLDGGLPPPLPDAAGV